MLAAANIALVLLSKFSPDLPNLTYEVKMRRLAEIITTRSWDSETSLYTAFRATGYPSRSERLVDRGQTTIWIVMNRGSGMYIQEAFVFELQGDQPYLKLYLAPESRSVPLVIDEEENWLKFSVPVGRELQEKLEIGRFALR